AKLSARGFTGELTMHVVGIAADARSQSLIEPMPPVAYWPFHTVMPMWFSLIVRSRGAPAALESELQRALASVDPNIPLEFRTVSDNIRKQIAEQRMLATTFYLFSALAVLLAAVGLYGVLGTAVNERRREFGIRLALGADPQRILSMVVAQSARIILVGLMLGITGAVWLSRLLQAQLYGVNRFSGEVYLAAAVIFGVAALIATAIPTRAATRVEPTTALRQE
ncbi:MAG TPA: FtsX-like permease family protein, partial [Longimicrobiales bacterium]|nr:FtsX-like permease family protein [Longimicrobiales bacterium]